MKRIMALVALVLALAACTNDDPAPYTGFPDSEFATSNPVAQRTAEAGKPFDLHPWQITVKSLACGTVGEVQKSRGTDGEQLATDHSCVIELSYKNIDTSAHQWGMNPTSVEAGAIGVDERGARYEGWSWVDATVNPGLASENQLIFPVAPFTKLIKLRIGDVVVAL